MCSFVADLVQKISSHLIEVAFLVENFHHVSHALIKHLVFGILSHAWITYKRVWVCAKKYSHTKRHYIWTPKLFKYCIFPSPRTLLSYCSSTNTKINESLSQPYHEAYQDSKQSKSSIKHNNKLKPTLDEGPGSNLLGTNLDRFEANWILELDYTLVPSLILGSPNHELSF